MRSLLIITAVILTLGGCKRASFWQQCKVGDTAAVSEALRSDPRLLEQADPESQALPLYLAAANGRSELVALLLQQGARVDARNQYGTALHVAAQEQDIKIVRQLMSAHADVKARDDWGHTPLHGAALRNQRDEVVTALLDAGADVSARDAAGLTPLHRAKHLAVVKVLLARGADVKAVDAQGRTALHWAAAPREMYELDVVRLLIEKGVPVDAVDGNGETAVRLAERDGKGELVQVLGGESRRDL